MDEIRPEFGNAPECPKGFTPNHKMDAVNEEKRYYRSQWLAERDRADALAAHVERISEWWGDEAKTKLDLEEFAAIISDQPTTSLARLKAECWKEAYLAGMEHGHHWTVEGGYTPNDEEAAEDYVKERQSEGGE